MAVTWLIPVVAFLVLFGTLLAMAEASISRMTLVRAMALNEEGRRNAATLERIETDPPRYLNSVYLTVMFVQNGSAILVAIIAEHFFGNLGITLVSLGFTLAYFVLVEAMSKTYAILHSDRVALSISPLVAFLARLLSGPTRVLIKLANVLLPGKGIKEGPFVSEEDIRSMADYGHEEGAIEEGEKELIHRTFEFGDTIVREVMVPRPDMIAVDVRRNLRSVLDLIIKHGKSRIPVYRDQLDEVVGVLYAKDILKRLHANRTDTSLEEIMRAPLYVPESKKVAELLREMQARKIHISIVIDEYGSTAGLCTIEDLLEELVGEIADEYDRDDEQVKILQEGVQYRVHGRLPIDELNELLDVELPDDEWDTVGGLMFNILGTVPAQGQEVPFGNILLKAERVQGRRIARVLVTKLPDSPNGSQPPAG